MRLLERHATAKPRTAKPINADQADDKISRIQREVQVQASQIPKNTDLQLQSFF
jgi:hypothetical protein